MISDFFKIGKGLYSKWFSEYRLDDTDIENLQKRLLEIFVAFKKLCDDNGIRYMLCGGSLLGTVRHQGFIPWDDDIDIMILREDYDRFVKVFEKAKQKGEMPDYILAKPFETKGYYLKIPRLLDKTTEYVTVNYMGIPDYNMVGIDLFILEKEPENTVLRTVRYAVFRFAFLASSFCIDYMFPSRIIIRKSKDNKELRKYYAFRRSIGALFAHIGGIRMWLGICKRLKEYRGETSLRRILTGLPWETYRESEIMDISKGMFCGYEVNMPGHHERYLTCLFGDYMKIPPESEREVHVAYKMKL